jgi:hypothetical protein
MCPGGEVIAAASEPGGVVTDGMSLSARGADNANAAVVVGVSPQDLPSGSPLPGFEFQRHWEGLAFALGGASHAGGIMTAAADGVRVAEAIIGRHALPG